jgi:hypothetical protein
VSLYWNRNGILSGAVGFNDLEGWVLVVMFLAIALLDDQARFLASAKRLLAVCLLLKHLEFSALCVFYMPSFWKQ